MNFGVVSSMGQTQVGTWGAAVKLDYLLHQPTIDLLPEEGWAGAAMLKKVSPGVSIASREWLGSVWTLLAGHVFGYHYGFKVWKPLPCGFV